MLLLSYDRKCSKLHDLKTHLRFSKYKYNASWYDVVIVVSCRKYFRYILLGILRAGRPASMQEKRKERSLSYFIRVLVCFIFKIIQTKINIT